MAQDWVDYRDGSDGETYTEDDQVLKTVDNSDMDRVHYTQVNGFTDELMARMKDFFTIASEIYVVTCLAEYEGIEKGYRVVVQRHFTPWNQLPVFGLDTNRLEDLEQVRLQVRLFEPLYDARRRIDRMT